MMRLFICYSCSVRVRCISSQVINFKLDFAMLTIALKPYLDLAPFDDSKIRPWFVTFLVTLHKLTHFTGTVVKVTTWIDFSFYIPMLWISRHSDYRLLCHWTTVYWLTHYTQYFLWSCVTLQQLCAMSCCQRIDDFIQ